MIDYLGRYICESEAVGMQSVARSKKPIRNNSIIDMGVSGSSEYIVGIKCTSRTKVSINVSTGSCFCSRASHLSQIVAVFANICSIAESYEYFSSAHVHLKSAGKRPDVSTTKLRVSTQTQPSCSASAMKRAGVYEYLWRAWLRVVFG